MRSGIAVGNFVSLQQTAGRINPSAAIAGEFFATMELPVLGQVGSGSKHPIALFASVRILRGVCFHVSGQLALEGKSFSANRTRQFGVLHRADLTACSLGETGVYLERPFDFTLSFWFDGLLLWRLGWLLQVAAEIAG